MAQAMREPTGWRHGFLVLAAMQFSLAVVFLLSLRLWNVVPERKFTDDDFRVARVFTLGAHGRFEKHVVAQIVAAAHHQTQVELVEEVRVFFLMVRRGLAPFHRGRAVDQFGTNGKVGLGRWRGRGELRCDGGKGDDERTESGSDTNHTGWA